MKKTNNDTVELYCNYFMNQLNSENMTKFRNELQSLYDNNSEEIKAIPINPYVIGDIKYVEKYEATTEKFFLQVDDLLKKYNLEIRKQNKLF